MTAPKKENYELVLYRLDQIDKKLDNVTKNYVTKEEFEDFKQMVSGELKKKSLMNVVNPIIASVTTALVTYLLIAFLNK
tara:strand:+ start:7534 stop:7770 length:237 start_codon:yes stop_codon:yes gene_type:complete